MTTVSVRELNANVSAIVSRVEAGEVLTLTKHGRMIADIVPRRGGLSRLAAISSNTPLERGTPEWQAAYDQMIKTMEKGYHLGGQRVTYKDKHE